MSAPIRIGMVGLGSWGKNLLRNLGALPEAELVWCCDPQESTRMTYAGAYPAARFTTVEAGRRSLDLSRLAT